MDGPEDSLRSQEKLIGDLRQVIENAEELLKNTDRQYGAQYQNARASLAQALHKATEELTRFEDAQLDRMISATAAAAAEHHDHSGEARILRAFR